MRSALRHRGLPDERARRHLVNRLPSPQAGSADSTDPVPVNNADGGFSLTGPITITVIVPPSPSPTLPAVTTSPTIPAVTTTDPPAAPPLPATTSTSSPTAPATTSTPSSTSSSTSLSSTGTAVTSSSAGVGNSATGPATTVQPSVSVVPPGQSNSGGNGNGVSGANGAISSGAGLSTGAIVGIVISILAVLIAAVVFFLRRKNVFARKKRRATWLAKGGIMGPKPIPGYDSFLPTTSEKPPPPAPAPYGYASTRNTYVPGAATEAAAYAYSTNQFVPAGSQQQQAGYSALPPPPPTSYNNYSAPSPTTSQTPVVRQNAVPATVTCTFIPTLPDELNISAGDIIRVLAEYDDGWALCMNSREEQGMVPLECLDRNGSGSGAGRRDTREYRRASSLTGSQPGAGGAPLAPNRLGLS